MKTILFVDDEKLIVQSFRELLEMEDGSNNLDIQTFTSKSCGKDTLHWIEHNKPDIAVLDIILNGVSGIDIANKLISIYKKPKIVFLTGCDESTAMVKKAKDMIESHENVSYYNKLDDNWYEDIIEYIIEQTR